MGGGFFSLGDFSVLFLENVSSPPPTLPLPPIYRIPMVIPISLCLNLDSDVWKRVCMRSFLSINIFFFSSLFIFFLVMFLGLVDVGKRTPFFYF